MPDHAPFPESCRDIRLLLFDCDGVLTDGRIVLGHGGLDLKFFSTRDGIGINLWRQAGLLCGCISGRYSEALQRRAEELGFDELHQKVGNKRTVVAEIKARWNLSRHQVAFIGDDLNDLGVRTEVGLFLTPADAHPHVAALADYRLGTRGGHGAVREAVDLILSEKGVLDDLFAQYLD